MTKFIKSFQVVSQKYFQTYKVSLICDFAWNSSAFVDKNHNFLQNVQAFSGPKTSFKGQEQCKRQRKPYIFGEYVQNTWIFTIHVISLWNEKMNYSEPPELQSAMEWELEHRYKRNLWKRTIKYSTWFNTIESRRVFDSSNMTKRCP